LRNSGSRGVRPERPRPQRRRDCGAVRCRSACRWKVRHTGRGRGRLDAGAPAVAR
jgi:hypothetical protein